MKILQIVHWIKTFAIVHAGIIVALHQVVIYRDYINANARPLIIHAAIKAKEYYF